MSFRVYESFLHILRVMQIVHVLHMFHTSRPRCTIRDFCLHTKRFEIQAFVLHGGNVSSHVEVVQTMVDRIKTALEEAQANLFIAANWAKAYADAS